MRLILSQRGLLLSEVQIDAATVQIGRTPSCHVVLPGTGIARCYGVIEQLPNGYAVVDMGSPAGIFVGGRRVMRAIIHEETTVRIGDFEITVAEEEILEPEIIDEVPVPHAALVDDLFLEAPRRAVSAC